MKVTVLCNTDEETIFNNIYTNSRKDVDWIGYEKENDLHAVIVGGGPSIEDCIKEIRWRQEQGQKVFALNNAAAYLASYDILPDYQVILDARESNINFVGNAKEYLIASQVHPSVLDKAIESGETKLWFPLIEGTEKHIPEKTAWTYIGGGTTVGLCAMCLAHTMGFRNLHLFGYDSSYKDNKGHAYNQIINEKEAIQIKTWVGGKKYISPITMAKQAELWPELAHTLSEAGSEITVHGYGLLPAIAHMMEAGWPEMGTLNAVYDLNSSPPTYDFFTFLKAAEETRLNYRFKDIHVYFQPGLKDGFRDDNLPPDLETRKNMLWRVCVNGCRLLPSVSRVTVMDRREEVSEPLFPEQWTVENCQNYYGVSLMKGIRPLRSQNKINKTNYVTITIRESSYWPSRNSNRAEWEKAAKEIELMGYEVVWIEDTEKNPEFLDIDYRLSLYENAVCNLGVANGPMSLCILSESPYIMFKLIVDDDSPAHKAEFYKNHGIEIGDQFGDNGVLVWDDDNAENIIEAFVNFNHLTMKELVC